MEEMKIHVLGYGDHHRAHFTTVCPVNFLHLVDPSTFKCLSLDSDNIPVKVLLPSRSLNLIANEHRKQVLTPSPLLRGATMFSKLSQWKRLGPKVWGPV